MFAQRGTDWLERWHPSDIMTPKKDHTKSTNMQTDAADASNSKQKRYIKHYETLRIKYLVIVELHTVWAIFLIKLQLDYFTLPAFVLMFLIELLYGEG